MADGDRDAALVLVRRFQSRVFGLTLSITRDRGLAEESAQDAFVKAWRYASSFDPRRGSVAAWLLSIARNAALDQARASRRRPEQANLELVADLVGEDDIDSAYEDLVPIARAVRSLPDDQRAVLMAAVYRG